MKAKATNENQNDAMRLAQAHNFGYTQRTGSP